MTQHSQWIAYTDGASRGNPGKAAYAFVLLGPGGEVYQEAECLGTQTNNQAEYAALLNALRRAAELGIGALEIRSDSELMVKQMMGIYQVKNADLRDLFLEAKRAAATLSGPISYVHVRREANKLADSLCNDALDGKPRSRPNPGEAAREMQTLPTAAFAAASVYPAGLLQTLETALAEVRSGIPLTTEGLARRLAPYLKPGP
ncbi:MAG: ribonuclease HI family protein [Gemmataceae bacterium]|jgi:ribonuclease HI